MVADHVVKSYGPVPALRGVSFRISAGETVALLGPNGAGKSTLLRLLLGLGRPDGGALEVLGGRPAEAANIGQLGAMFQVGGLPEKATVAEALGIFSSFYPHPLPVDAALDTAGIEDLAGRRLERLSGGQAQRARFALAIIGDPELVFLDEPTTGMDVEARGLFWSTMRAWAATGRTLVFASHHLDEVEAAADRLIVLAAGRVVADGTPREVRAATGVKTIRFRLRHGQPHELDVLPAVLRAVVHQGEVTLHTSDADATIAALFGSGRQPHDLEITGVGLEDVFVELTSGRS